MWSKTLLMSQLENLKKEDLESGEEMNTATVYSVYPFPVFVKYILNYLYTVLVSTGLEAQKKNYFAWDFRQKERKILTMLCWTDNTDRWQDCVTDKTTQLIKWTNNYQSDHKLDYEIHMADTDSVYVIQTENTIDIIFEVIPESFKPVTQKWK